MRQLFFIPIPTNQSFLSQWHAWIQGKVSRHYKRNKSRMGDTAQNVRLRLLTKDFIGRWFYKHLSDELVEREEAQAMLGGVPVTFVGSLKPYLVVPRGEYELARTPSKDGSGESWLDGRRAVLDRRPDSKVRLYKVSDILAFARFDYDRYYYSVQNHTIDSDKVLRLLGYREGQYTALQSLWRSRGFRPSELTEHECSGPECSECDRGRASLRSRGLSLAHDWGTPGVAGPASRLRWNDSQLRPLLREWRRANMLKRTPLSIVRLAPSQGIDAGLLKYAQIIIDNEVSNDFKRMSRADDLETYVQTGGLCPAASDGENLAWEDGKDGEERSERVFRDADNGSRIRGYEIARDLHCVLDSVDLTEEERGVIDNVDLGESGVHDYSARTGMSPASIVSARARALARLKASYSGDMLRSLSNRYSCRASDIVDPRVVCGGAVRARTEMFYSLSRMGISPASISSVFGFPVERVSLSISRHPEARAFDGDLTGA